MNVPTIENEQAGSVVDSSGQEQDSGTASTSTGPSVTLSFADGSTRTIGKEELQFYLLAIQTLLLLYVTFAEVSR